jgi:hypothetical protein
MSDNASFSFTAAAVLLVVCLGITGCTYMLIDNNRMYYDTMSRCIEQGGTFIPTRTNSSEAACVIGSRNISQ